MRTPVQYVCIPRRASLALIFGDLNLNILYVQYVLAQGRTVCVHWRSEINFLFYPLYLGTLELVHTVRRTVHKKKTGDIAKLTPLVPLF